MTRITSIVASLSLVAFVACTKAENKDEVPGSAAAEPVPGATSAEAPVSVVVKPAAVEVGKLTADELDGLMRDRNVSVFDSNGDKVRDEHGKIPSATLLTHYADYKMGELPTDKSQKLVFYCSNTQCGASKKSATKAIAAGYSDVNILPVGVIGWKESGKSTEKAL